MNFSSPPAGNEIEIVILGPEQGYGESILVHYGNSQWIVIDSCLNPKTKEPLALEYLTKLYGTKAKNLIKHVLVTHWHDDHIQGISKIYQFAEDAELAWSSILSKKESYKVVTRCNQRKSYSALSELYSLLHQRRERIDSKRGNPSLNPMSKNNMLFHSEDMSIYGVALSPSGDMILANNLNLGKVIAENLGEPINYKSRIPNITPNYSSVVLLIKIKHDFLLFGADLEFVFNNHLIGMADALNCTFLNKVKPQIYKIAHHGSVTSYSKEMWNSLFEKNKFHAVLTSYRKGGEILPKQDMVETMLEHNSDIYITSNPYALIGEPLIEPEIMSNSPESSQKSIGCGIIQLRKKVGAKSNWGIYCTGSAMRLEELSSKVKSKNKNQT